MSVGNAVCAPQAFAPVMILITLALIFVFAHAMFRRTVGLTGDLLRPARP